jgi:hypothetical protein
MSCAVGWTDRCWAIDLVTASLPAPGGHLLPKPPGQAAAERIGCPHPPGGPPVDGTVVSARAVHKDRWRPAFAGAGQWLAAPSGRPCGAPTTVPRCHRARGPSPRITGAWESGRCLRAHRQRMQRSSSPRGTHERSECVSALVVCSVGRPSAPPLTTWNDARPLMPCAVDHTPRRSVRDAPCTSPPCALDMTAKRCDSSFAVLNMHRRVASAADLVSPCEAVGPIMRATRRAV